jgi:hypothetical protein
MCRIITAVSTQIVLIIAMLSLARAETLDELYEKAKLERALVIYTGAGPAVAKATAEAFEKRFPGIMVTAKGGFSNVLDLEIDQQLKSRNIISDFAQFQTIQDYSRWENAGVLMHFKPDAFEQVFPTMKDKNGAWVAVSAVPLFYGYNPDKVQEVDSRNRRLIFSSLNSAAKLSASILLTTTQRFTILI